MLLAAVIEGLLDDRKRGQKGIDTRFRRRDNNVVARKTD